MENERAPRRCASKFAGMRCESTVGHLLTGEAHRSSEWRWNSRMQWTVVTLPLGEIEP